MIQFTQDDYNSNDGMLTSVWGPVMWHMLHTISFNYPVKPTPEERHDYYKFFKKLVKILPCGTCRDNLYNNYNDLEFGRTHFTDRDTLSRFVYSLHEKINTMLNKRSGLSYEDVRNKYELLRARCIEKKDCNNHTGCSEWLHGMGKDKPCTYIVITNSNKSNKFHKILKSIKEGIDTDMNNGESECKIVIGDDIYKTCNNNRTKYSSQVGGDMDITDMRLLEQYSKQYYNLTKKGL